MSRASDRRLSEYADRHPGHALRARRCEDALLFWEDIDEPLYRLDRMLTQLRLSGSLAGLRGMVVGDLQPADETPDLQPTLPEILEELACQHGWPVAYDCPSGHCRPNLTLPLGCEARLDAAAGRLVVGEPS